MELMLIDACLLVYAMLLLHFKDACLLFSMVFVKKLLRYSWTIFPSMELPLIIVCTTLIKFCRDVKKLISFLIGRSATLWLMKELFLGIDRAKVEAIEKMPYPRDVKGIHSILGLAGFYRRFIKYFSKVSKPL